MRGILLSVLVFMVAFMTGCPQGPSKNFPGGINPGSGPTTTKSLVTNINGYLKQKQLDFDAAATPAEKQRIRNDAIDDVLAVIDDNYTVYISNIEARRSSTDFLLDVIELGTGAATGIAKGERPNQILGIALTAFRGGRKSSELNFYKQQTTPILISKMDDNRDTVLGDILEKKPSPASDYSMKGAIRDLVKYYNAGTLVRAFTELAKSTAVQAQASQARVRHLSGPLKISAIPSLALDEVLVKIDQQKQNLIQQVMSAEAASPLPAAPAVPTAPQLTARTAALQPVRAKLISIWGKVESNTKLAVALAAVKATPADAAILAKAPAAITEDDYLNLLDDLSEKIKTDVDLSRELLSILMTVNP